MILAKAEPRNYAECKNEIYNQIENLTPIQILKVSEEQPIYLILFSKNNILLFDYENPENQSKTELYIF
jgi:hypothetical protein